MKRHSRKKKKKNPAALLLLLLLAAAAFGIALMRMPKAEAVPPQGTKLEEQTQVEKNNGTISIPGYEGIKLTAGTKQQTVGFINPAQNSCYFRISLLLEDGTELWVSELIEPGEISEPVKLSRSLESGTYPNSVLKYECFTMDGSMTPLNGAATKLTLWVG